MMKNKQWHSYLWMILWIGSFLMVMPSNRTAQAQEAGGYWEQISVDVEKATEPGAFYFYNISRGSGTFRAELNGESFQATMTWTEPGQRYAAGQSVDLTISVNIDEYVWDDDAPGYTNLGLNYMGAAVRAWRDWMERNIDFKDSQGNYSAKVSTNYGKIAVGSQTLQVSAEFPSGGSDGDKLSIVVGCTAGRNRYNYQWVENDSAGFTTNPENEEPEPNWEPLPPTTAPGSGPLIPRVIVVVGIAIAGTLSTIAAELANKAAQAAASSEEEQPKEEMVYVLNPSHKQFDLEVNKLVTLTINAYRVTKEGHQIEEGANISLNLPPDLAEYFSIQTSTSPGQLTANITLLKIPSASAALLDVNGVFPQGKAKTEVKLMFRMDFSISPVHTPNITFNEKEKFWQPPELVACFRDPVQDSPIKVGFYYGFMDPPLTFEPDILEVKEGYSSDDGLTYNFKLNVRDEIDLEKVFGEDLTDDDGRVTVKVVVKDEKGKEYAAKTALQVHPQLKMISYAYDPEKGISKRGRPKTTEGIELKDMQFIADGKDILPLVFFFVRTDKELEEGEEYLNAIDLVDVESIEFVTGTFSDPEKNEADCGNGLFAYKIQSDRAILYSEKQQEKQTLEVTARTKASASKNIGVTSKPLHIEVYPQFLKFDFWVVPGQYKDTSEAFAHVQLHPSKIGVPNMSLSLEVENPPERDRGFLELVNGDREQTTRDKDYYQSTEYVPLMQGSACWALKYSKMSWDNLSSCIFKITCYGPESDTGPIWQMTKTIDVGQNINNLLSDLVNESGRLDLNNPYWKDSICPYHMRGVIWNLVCKGDPKQPYVCHWLREKIMGWLTDRSLYNEHSDPKKIESMMRMNGIEFQYCSFTPLHVWANLFLSGSHQINDAKALDPWWEQRWTDSSLKDHKNLITVYSELNWKLSERGLGLRAIAEVQAGVLFFAGIVSLISILVPFLIPITIPSAVNLIMTTYIGGVPFHAIVLYGGTVDYDNYLPDGKKRLFYPNWFANFIKDLSKSND